jgi:fucose permease
MKEITILIAVNVVGFALGWFFGDRVVKWINESKYSRAIKATLHTLLWSAILIGGLVNGMPAWVTVLTVIAYLMSILGVFID